MRLWRHLSSVSSWSLFSADNQQSRVRQISSISTSSSPNIQRLRGRAVSNRSHPDDSADPRPDQNSLEHARVVLEIRSLSMRFENTVVLNNIQLTLHEGQTLVILGASGCGKTTLLKIIAGLLNGYTGSVQLTTTRPPGNSARNTSVLYLDQEPLLFEHLNVAENIAFAMRMQRCAGDEIERDVNELLRSIELSEHRSRCHGDYQVAKSSGSPLPGQYLLGHICSCSMNHSAASMLSRAHKCSNCSQN